MLGKTIEELENISSTEFYEWLAYIDIRNERSEKDRGKRQTELERKARAGRGGKATMGNVRYMP